MAASREVSISVQLDDGKSEAAFKRIKARFEEIGDVSDRALKQAGANLERQLIVAYNRGGNRELLETTRRLAPELRQIQEQLKMGSLNVEDFNRRMSILPRFTREAAASAEKLGLAFKKADADGALTFQNLIQSSAGGNLIARAISNIGRVLQQLTADARNSALEVELVVASIATIANVNTDQISDALFNLSTRVPQTAQQLGEGLYNIFSSVEASQEQALKLLEGFSKGAVAARTDTQTFGTAVIGVINAYKLNLEEASHVSDVFFNTVKRGVVNGQELANGLGFVTQAAKNAGVNIDELGGMIAGVTKEGGQAAQNINNLSNFLQKLPIGETTRELERIGITIKDAEGKFRPVLNILGDLKQTLDTMPPAIRAARLQEIFPDVQARTGALTLMSQLDFVKNATLENARAVGVAEDAYKKMSGTAAAQFSLLYNSLIALFSKMIGWVTQSQLLGTVLGRLSSVFQTLANNAGAVLLLAGALTGLAVAFTAVKLAAGAAAIAAYFQALGSALPVIINVGRAMIGLSTTFATTGAALTAATGGWFAIISVVGLAIYALTNYMQSTKQVETADKDRIDQLTRMIDIYKEDIAFLKDQSISIQNSTEARMRYDSILKSVSVTNRLQIKEIGDEIKQREALAGVLQSEMDLRKGQLVAEAIRAAVAASVKLQEGLEAEEKLNRMMDRRKLLLEDLNGVQVKMIGIGGGMIEQITSNRDVLASWETQIAETSTEHEAAIKILNEQTDVLALLAMGAKQTGQKFLEMNGILATNITAQYQLGDAIDKTIAKINEQKEAALRAGKAMRDYANDIQIFQFAKPNVEPTNEGVQKLAANIQNQLQIAVANGKDYNETLRQMIPLFNQLKSALRSGAIDAKDYNERLKLIPPEVQKAFRQFEKFGQYNPFEKTTKGAKDAKKAVRDLGDAGLQMSTGNRQWDAWVRESSARYGNVDPNLIFAQMRQESSFKRTAISNKGASGLMQLMPATARRFGVKNIFDPRQNIEGGVKYMSWLMKEFGGSVPLALAGYNAGEGAVMKYKSIPPYKETQNYVKRIMSSYKSFGGSGSGGGADDWERMMAELSDRITKEARDTVTRELIEAAKFSGVMPNEDVLRDYNRLQIEEARRSGTLQPTLEETKKKLGLYELATHITPRELPPMPDYYAGMPEDRKAFKQNLEQQFNIGQRQLALDERRKFVQDEILAKQLDYELSLDEALQDLTVEAELLKQRKLDTEAVVEFERQRNAQVREIGDIEVQLSVLRAQNADAAFVTQRRELAVKREQLSLEREIADLKDQIANAGINDAKKIEAAQLRDILDLRNRELNAVIAINRAELELSQSMKVSNNQIRARVLEHLASQKSMNEAIADGVIGTYETLAGMIDSQIDKMFEWAGKFKGLFSFITEPLKTIGRDLLTGLTRSLLNSIFPGLGTTATETQNPIAKPIVTEINRTNMLLEQLVRATGQVPATGGIGGGLGAILGGIFGGGSGSGSGMFQGGLNLGSYTNFFRNSGSAGGGLGSLISGLVGGFGGVGGGGGSSGGRGFPFTGLFGGAPIGSRTGDIVGDAVQVFAGDKGRGNLWSNLKYLFSGKKGGLFGGFGGGLSGTIGGVASLGMLAGGLIGGKAGSAISGIAGGALAGLTLGAKFGAIGGPLGAAIGAGAGFLMSILGGLFGSPKRKRDKKEKMPQLTQGFADALKELNEILAGVRSLSIDPDSALSQAAEVRSKIASGFGIQFESKKYRKQSQQQIAAKLVEADKIIEEIKKAAEIARGAADRNKRILPEFAGGHYFADYFKPNGLLPGMFDGRDNIFAMISRGEMILNPHQQNNVRRRAGFDVFAGAGIPHYPRANPAARLATGGIAGSGISMLTPQVNLTLHVAGDMALADRIDAWAESDGGKRTQIQVIRKLKKTGDI